MPLRFIILTRVRTREQDDGCGREFVLHHAGYGVMMIFPRARPVFR